MKISLKINKKLFIFLFFLLISTVLWFLNALNKTYDTTINIPVSFHEMPINKYNVSELPKFFEMQINANGFTILKYKFKSKIIPLKFSAKSLDLKQSSKEDTSKFYILSYKLKQKVEKQTKSDINIIKIKPDSIFFQFSQLSSKKVLVGFNAEIKLKKQFMLKDMVVIEPDSIIIQGPRAILDTIYHIDIEQLNLEALSDNINKTVKLVEPENIILSQSEVNIIITVEQYTEANLYAPIELINFPDTLDIKIFPNKVKIIYLVGESFYGKISKEQFNPIVDFNSNKNNINNKLQVQIIGQPENIKSYKYYPQSVDYIIE